MSLTEQVVASTVCEDPMKSAEPPQKVVVHLLDGTVMKGELCLPLPITLDDALESATGAGSNNLKLTSVDGELEYDFPLSQVKAMFIVDSFEGDRSRELIRFCTHDNDKLGLWVEVKFEDGEVMEGIIYNSIHHLVTPGFLLTPSDPRSNNRVVYINKSAIQSFRVLGLRQMF